MEAKDKMIIALKQFSESYYHILILWDEAHLNDLDSVSEYPFSVSFDELRIPEWVTAVLNDLMPINDDYDNADESSGNMPCDNTGYCDPSCPRFGIDCNGI